MAKETKETKDVKKKKTPWEIAIGNIEKTLGNKGEPIIRRFGDIKGSNVSAISFGDANVDGASYCGGVPEGKMVEIFGPESGGKSLLSLKLIASAQKSGKKALLVDAEQSFDPLWAASHGVDVQELCIINAALSAEALLDYVAKACDSGAFGLVVVDSTAALVPQKELEGTMGDQDVALLARVMSKACRQIMQGCGKTKTTCVFLNQIRENIGKMFGDTTTTPGGRALKFYCHQRIQVIPYTKIKVKENGKEVIIARTSIVKFVKNKVARPFGECLFTIVFDKNSMNPVVKMCNMAKDMKIFTSYKGELRLHKDYTEDGKVLETKTTDMVNLADYCVKNNLIKLVSDAILDMYDNADDEEKKEWDITPIQEMRDNPSLIVSPLADSNVEKTEAKSTVDETLEIDGAEFDDKEEK